MIILGFDPSKSTGWAVYDTTSHISAIKCGVFEMPTKADEYYTADQLALKVKALVREVGHKSIDFAVLEEQSKAQIGGVGASGIIYPWLTSAAIVGTLANFGILYGTIPVGAWHKMFYGQGYKPPQNKNGKNDWKAAAVAQCEAEHIVLPRQKTIAHNAAEACAIAICWHGAKVHAGRYQKRFIELRQRRNEREPAIHSQHLKMVVSEVAA